MLRTRPSLYLSSLTIAEYDKGSANLPGSAMRWVRYMDLRARFIARFAARLLPLADGIVRRWGVISGTVRRDTGHAPPVIDTLLAVTALEHNLYLAPRNVRDVRQSGAAVFNPWEDDPAAFPLTPLPRHVRRRET